MKNGAVAVIPTDTVYGIVCSVRLPDVVEKLYTLRGRDHHKPCIILLSDISGLEEFGIAVSTSDGALLHTVWPGKVSVVFDCPKEQWLYLHRGTKTLAFRVPDDRELRNLLHNIGPLIAPSANTAGSLPAHTLAEAKNYFGDQISLYVDGGYCESLPSTVARLKNGVWEVLRKGAVTL